MDELKREEGHRTAYKPVLGMDGRNRTNAKRFAEILRTTTTTTMIMIIIIIIIALMHMSQDDNGDDRQLPSSNNILAHS